MSGYQPSRRRFLQQTFAFSAAAALSSLTGCGASGSSSAGTSSGNNPGNSGPAISHLLMLGDYGVQNPSQGVVAAAMQSYVAKLGISTQALLMLGDNFYDDLTGLSDSRWQSGFEQMYPASVFNCPCYAIPGNHDYQVSPVAKYPVQLAYAAQGNTRWTMPAQYYSFLFPAVNPVVTFLAIDTNIPYPDGSTVNGSFYTMTQAQREAQAAWLEAQLALPRKTPYLAVLGHHPLYSDGPHGDNPGLISDIDNLLRKNSVHFYFGGHDHDLQHLEFSGHPTSFFLSGSGGQTLYQLSTQPTVRGPFAQMVYGFSHMEVQKDLVTLRHIGMDGSVLHAFAKTADGTVSILA